jgi:hypothetical protein
MPESSEPVNNGRKKRDAWQILEVYPEVQPTSFRVLGACEIAGAASKSVS